MDTQATGSTSNDIPRDAIIYIPGINYVANQTLENVTQQIADAIEHSSKETSVVFSVEATSHQAEYTKRKLNYRTILREEDGKSTRAMDVYELDYLSSLTHDYAGRHPLNLLLRMLLVIAINLDNLINFLRSGAKTAKEKTQILLALLAAGAIVVYIVIVIAAIITLARELPEFQTIAQGEPTSTAETTENQNSYPAPRSAVDNSEETTPAPAYVTGVWITIIILIAITVLSAAFLPDQLWWVPILTTVLTLILILIPLTVWPKIAQWIIVLIALLQLVWPKLFENLRKGIEQSAIYYMSVVDYISLSNRREPIEGHFIDLVEYVGERKPPYDQIYVVTYSFGGIVALDGIFPIAHAPAERVKVIDGLVTIGNPFDFFRSLWPTYFRGVSEDERDQYKQIPWLNVYSPIDILGSNFRKDEKAGSPQQEVINETRLNGTAPITNIAYPQNVSYDDMRFLELITFTGLQAHTTYFRTATEGETSCFIEIVPKLFKDTAWLA